GKRLEVLIEDPPDWLDGQARAAQADPRLTGIDGQRGPQGQRTELLDLLPRLSCLLGLLPLRHPQPPLPGPC
ncbi:hypothetical protein, partial [Sphingopyxis sp.]|uniref:hypothetical protein n=1 Tax=Sphingopyxis sp. TaxID=1908224 RepID=UPI0040372E76